jgi:hypothetical protein
MQSLDSKLTISDVSGPFREPREPVFSYDYSIQRPTWATPHGLRVKVSIAEELDPLKIQLLGSVTGTAGQQLVISKILSRTIADWKLRIADEEGMLTERRDVMVGPFTGPLAHLFPKLQALFEKEQTAVREEIKMRVRI